ncbi:MAG: hypothetical protein JWR27_705, partial [Aeromicrobium sp.]|nr:hypothetical protein [Aeromicrobium sp.]
MQFSSLPTDVDGVADRSRALVETSGATSVQAVSHHSQLRASADAWPATELAVLEAVRAEHLVERAVVGKGFLSILLAPGDDVAGARALAERPSGYASIVAVDVTDDPDSDLSNAGEGAGHARTSADVLRKEPGYRGLSVSSGFLRVTVDTLEHAEAMDTTLRTSSARAYDAVETIYKVEGVATVTRAGGTSAWFDTTEALVASGLFDSVQVGEPEPRGRARAIDV